jgi:hypothetical protein
MGLNAALEIRRYAGVEQTVFAPDNVDMPPHACIIGLAQAGGKKINLMTDAFHRGMLPEAGTPE